MAQGESDILSRRCVYDELYITSVARDFVEAPSQMLEYWCWEPKVLEKMSSHYETQKPLSADLIDKIIKRFVTKNRLSLLSMQGLNFRLAAT